MTLNLFPQSPDSHFLSTGLSPHVGVEISGRSERLFSSSFLLLGAAQVTCPSGEQRVSPPARSLYLQERMREAFHCSAPKKPQPHTQT